jgi:hypothetical protein
LELKSIVLSFFASSARTKPISSGEKLSSHCCQFLFCILLFKRIYESINNIKLISAILNFAIIIAIIVNITPGMAAISAGKLVTSH